MSLIENSMNTCKYSILNQRTEGGHTLVLVENINYYSLKGQGYLYAIIFQMSLAIGHWKM